jgi:hypothetical protein
MTHIFTATGKTATAIFAFEALMTVTGTPFYRICRAAFRATGKGKLGHKKVV